MASLPNPRTVTYEEWLEMPIVDEGIEEVVDGHIILMPPARSTHARIIARLMKALLDQLDAARYEEIREILVRRGALSTHPEAAFLAH